jgi:hypothetical protein
MGFGKLGGSFVEHSQTDALPPDGIAAVDGKEGLVDGARRA